MYMLTMGAGMNMGFPDVCLTPGVPPVPVPYPDTQFTATSAPATYNFLIDAMPGLNLMSKGLVSVGDEAGTLLGVVSHMISGEALYIVGCETFFVDGAPAQRLTSVTGQNCMGELPNTPGSCITPSQVTVLTLG